MVSQAIAMLSVRCCVRAIILSCYIASASLLIPAAQGELKHQYLFNEGPTSDASGRTIVDLISGANGTVIGPATGGQLPTATAHALVLPGGASTVAPYVDLPNGIISSLTNATFEGWYATNTVTNWGRVFDFGSTTGGELFAPGGGGEGMDYIFYAPQRGTNSNQQRAALRNNDATFGDATVGAGPVGGAESIADSDIPYTLGTQRHMAVVYNSTGGMGATPASLSLYIDGIQRGTVNTAIQLGNLNDVNNWLGRSNWTGDANFAGSMDEFRIYDHALSGEEVLDSFTTGPVGPIAPTLEVNRDTGAIVFRNEQPASQIVGYTITSAAGGLNQAAWLSVADNYDANSGGSFDNDNVWSELSMPGSKFDFSEFDFSTGGTAGGALGDGGALTALQLGGGGATDAQRAWQKSIYEDLAIAVRLADGSALPVTVRYVGNSGLPFQRSDLNFDGLVNITDWTTFLANAGSDLSSLTLAESYRRGDLTGDLNVGYADFRLFKSDFNALNGAGAFEALIAAVPEPSTLAMLVLGCAALARSRTRRGSRPTASTPAGSQNTYPRKCSRVLLLSLVAVFVVLPGQANAAGLKHRYRFNEGVTADATNRTVIDSVGGANGTVLGAGSSATATQLVLPGGDSATQAYVDLPNGIISSLTNATFESWYTMNGPTNWTRVFDFGSTAGPGGAGAPGMELTGPGGGGEGLDYIFYAPTRNAPGDQNLQRTAMRNFDPLSGGSEAGPVGGGEAPIVDAGIAYTLGTERHVAVVYNSTGGTGATPASLALYIDGIQQATGNTGIQLENLNDVNNWLGRSNWTGDQNLNGSFNEFRIYDLALSGEEIQRSFDFGPENVAGPDLLSLEVDPSSGQVRLVNELARPVTIDFYEITSAAGSLNTAWAGVDGSTTPGTGWDRAGDASENQLMEFYLPEGGFSVPANSQLSIGTAFNPGGVQDLQFRFALAAGILREGDIEYEAVATLPGDYNGDGSVDAADYVVWRKTGINGPAGYDTWRANFGRMAGAGAAANVTAAVPEPSTWASLACWLLGLGAWLTGTRRR